jgi:perosamine synthetase
VSSATAALHLALEGMGIGRGDDVVVPTYTFTACGEVCAYLGASVVLADVNDERLLGADQVQAALTPATRAIITVHFAGQAVDPGPIRAAAPNARIVEDAAHALPADLAGVPTGRLGDAAAFSFYVTKSMTTGGEGGMLVTDDDSLAERATRMRLHGIDADAWNRYGGGGKWFYEVTEAGFKYNLTDVAAAIGLAQLERLDELRADRARIAALYDTRFAESSVLRIPPRRQSDAHAWHLYVIELELEVLSIDRAAVIERMGAAGIGTSVHFIPLHLHPWYQRTLGYRPGDFPVAERLYERSLSLPIWPGMTEEQVSRVASTLLEICDDARRPVEV